MCRRDAAGDAETPKLICGVDEAGRGCLAGPITAAAVILDPVHPIEGLQDSKTLSASDRNKLCLTIYRQSFAYGIGWASAREIDRRGIEWANRIVFTRAVRALMTNLPTEVGSHRIHVQIDGNRRALRLGLTQETIVQGDQLVPEIAAASIVAKSNRDDYMIERLHAKFPHFGFHTHKGYATRGHVEAIATWGPTPEHRMSFNLYPRWGAEGEDGAV